MFLLGLILTALSGLMFGLQSFALIYDVYADGEKMNSSGLQVLAYFFFMMFCVVNTYANYR